MMPVKHIFLAFLGFASGCSVAGGTFALMVSLKIIPRMIGKSRTARHILLFETTAAAGGILGAAFTVYPFLPLPLGRPFLVLYGLCCGIQVGCLVMALAEIMNVFPILFRRFRLKTGLQWIIFSMAAGKMLGAFLYFFRQLGDG